VDPSPSRHVVNKGITLGSTWTVKRDALGLAALTLAVLALLLVLGWVYIFVGIKALSGLR